MKNIFLQTGFITLLFIFSISTSVAQCWKILQCGAHHNLGIKNNGTLWAWGLNDVGQIGNGTTTNQLQPMQIGTASNWSQISASVSSSHSLAIKSDGTLWAWGYNFYGQLGNGTGTNSHVPIQIGTSTNWAKVSAGMFFSLAIKTDGTLWAWGRNDAGQLGIGSNLAPNDIKLVPTKVGIATDWAIIEAGDAHSLAIKTDGSLWTWGSNLFGQLAIGNNINKTTPQATGTGFAWLDIAGGDGHTLAIRNDNTLWSSGENNSGELGIGSLISTNVLTQVGVATHWTQVSCGEYHSFAIKTDSTLWAWGENSYGQLGDNSQIDKTTPVAITPTIKWKDVDGGRQHSLGLTVSSDLHTWGRGSFGQLGNGTTTTFWLTPLLVVGTGVGNAGPDKMLGCNPTSVSIGVNTVAGTTYLWSPATGLNSTTISMPTTSATSTTIYTLVSTDALGCVMSDAVNVIVNTTPPNVSIFTTDPSIPCAGSSELYANGASDYVWMPGAETGDYLEAFPTVTTTYTVTGTNTFGCTATATQTILVAPCSSSLLIRLFLEGFFKTPASLKYTLLYAGVVNATANQCDTIRVELHQPTSPYNLIETHTVILDTTGYSFITFNNSGLHYLVIKNRNHVETWSNNPIDIGTVTTFDFTMAQNMAFGSNQVEVEPNIWAFYSGDINQDGIIDNGDYTPWETDANNFASGYLSTDLDGNGSVGNEDYIFWETNSNGFVGAIKP